MTTKMYHKEKDPLLDLILQKYIQTSRDSIRGPIALKTDSQLVTKSPLDNKKAPEIPDESKLRPTNLDGISNVASFSVGGEKRLCFTELVQTVLKDINVQEIFKKRDNLLIFTSKCTQKQLDELKYHAILPWTSTSSNLISKSDAYRLWGALQGPLVTKVDPNKRSQLSFEVYHECFGGCIGMFEPELYTDANTPCIKCAECNGLFSTQKFVSHNHSSYDEVHTCHWGFDSTRWRIYIMLVEQNPTRDLYALWDSVKYKFDINGYRPSHSNVERCQDADFVAYINSPDHKKAMVSPIENLRNREAKYESDHKESTSAFRPWSPPVSNKYPKSYSSRGESSHSSHFVFPSSGSSRSRNHEMCDRIYANHDCTRCPKSSMYMDCQQCKSAAQASCPSGLQMLAQKASERPGENLNRDGGSLCKCEKCQPNPENEGQFEEIIKNFTSKENKLTTSTRDLARLLSSEMKRMHISQDEKIKEFSISNQRLQTELQLVKMESQKKLSEARDTKAHVEQELETLHRERQKEISMFNQLRWELQRDVSCRKASGGASEVETLQKELTLLKSHLQQTSIDRENLQKQLDWYMNHRKTSNWTPYPTMARQFSDSEESLEDNKKLVWLKQPSAGPSKEGMSGQLSPVSKSRKLDEPHSTDDSSDIEVDN